MTTLFTDKDGNAYDAEDVKKVLYQIGAHDCETLFIHSDIMCFSWNLIYNLARICQGHCR